MDETIRNHGPVNAGPYDQGGGGGLPPPAAGSPGGGGGFEVEEEVLEPSLGLFSPVIVPLGGGLPGVLPDEGGVVGSCGGTPVLPPPVQV